jgi:dihydroxyacetone kinase-like predicted kinase
MKPVEGTILTVARESAKAATDSARTNSDVVVVLQAALVQARRTLALTPTMLPVLREARVVDAGGKGLVVALEGALRALQGGEFTDWNRVAAEERESKVQQPVVGARALSAEEAAEALKYKYCTEFILKGESKLNLERIKRNLGPHGDSMLVVGEGKVAKIHIHSNRPGFVLEYCVKLGDLSEIHINNMAEQNEELVANDTPFGGDLALPGVEPARETPSKPLGVVVVAEGKHTGKARQQDGPPHRLLSGAALKEIPDEQAGKEHGGTFGEQLDDQIEEMAVAGHPVEPQ